MIIGIDGGLGSGKTALMTGYLYEDFKQGFDVKANYSLNFKHDTLDVLSLLEKNPNLKDVSIGIDEITVFMDCRTSASKMNRLISYFILQSRKRNVTLYYTTQDFNMVDLRLINHTHIQIVCNCIYDEDGNPIDDIRKYTIFDFRNPHDIKSNMFYLDISNVYGLYNTDEIIVPPI